MSRIFVLALLAGVPTVAMVGCSTAPKTTTEQTDLMDASRRAIARAESLDPTLAPVLADSTGYAVFPSVGKGGFIVGGGFGRGVLYEHGVAVGYCSQTQSSLGAEIGGQNYTQIIAFNTPEALQQFKDGKTVMGAETTAIALKDGAASKTLWDNGMAVYAFADEGLQLQASISGQTFSYEPLAAEGAVTAGAKMSGSDSTNQRDIENVQDRGGRIRINAPDYDDAAHQSVEHPAGQ